MRLYTREEVKNILEKASFKVTSETWGDYEGNPPIENNSRIIILVEKPAS